MNKVVMKCFLAGVVSLLLANGYAASYGHVYQQVYEDGQLVSTTDKGTQAYEVASIGDTATHNFVRTEIYQESGFPPTGKVIATYTAGPYVVAPQSDAAIYERQYYTQKTYPVNYHPGEYGSPSKDYSATKRHGEPLELLGAAYTRTGYDQTGWSTSDGGAKKYDVGASYEGNAGLELYPYWTARQYNVTLNKNGGTCEDLTSYTYGVGATLPIATKDGHAFGGWYDNPGFSGNPVTAISKTETGDKEFWAKFTEDKFAVSTQTSPSAGGEVTVHPNKGVGAVYSRGDEVTLTATPNDGYVFDRWSITGYPQSTDKECTITVTQDVYCTAYFKTAPTQYTITTSADPAEGGAVSGGGKHYDGDVVQLVATANAGYSFEKWLDDPSAAASRQITVAGDATYTACFAGNTYEVMFNAKPGKGAPDPIDVTFGQKYGKLEDPTTPPEGQMFVGWYTAKTGGELITQDSVVAIAEDHTLYARYAEIVYDSYYVAFDGNGATNMGAMAVQTIPVGTATALEANRFGKAGNDFAGWSTTKGGDVDYADRQEVTDIADPGKTNTLYASWTPWKNYVRFDGSGATNTTMAVQAFEYGVAQALAENEYQKPGNTFLGWATNGTEAVCYTNGQLFTSTLADGATNVLKAAWLTHRYTIHFEPGAPNVKGEMDDIVDVLSGRPGVKLPKCAYSNLVSEGFDHWLSSKGKMYTDEETINDYYADEDGEILTLTAVWKGVGKLSEAVGLTNAALKASGSGSGAWQAVGSGGLTNGPCVQCIFSTIGGGTSTMSMRVEGPGTLWFWWKGFGVNGDVTFCALVDDNPVKEWSSVDEGQWSRHAYYLADADEHVISWTIKGEYDSAGNFYVDDVVWQPGGPVYYDITTDASPAVGGTVAGGGSYLVGTTNVVTASPNEGYKFLSWSDGMEEPRRTVEVISNATYTANFGSTLSDLSIAVGLTNANLKANGAVGGKGWEAVNSTGQLGAGYDYCSFVAAKADDVAKMSMTVTGPGKLSFEWKKTGEVDAHKFLLSVANEECKVHTSWGTGYEEVRDVSIPAGEVEIAWCLAWDPTWEEFSKSSIQAYVKNVVWTPDAPNPPPTPADARDIASVTMSDGQFRMTFTNADERFGYQLRGTNDLLVPMPWPVMWTTNGTGTIVIEPPKTEDPQMFYYLQTIQKQ